MAATGATDTFDDASATFGGGATIEPIRFDASDLDPSASPRIDLDAFVNARWRAANPVPPDRSCWDSFALLAERALQAQAAIAAQASGIEAPVGSVQRIVGDFWASGMADSDREGAELLQAELARIDALESSAAIAAYIVARHARGCALLFRFDVEPDFDDPERMIAYVGQAGLGLPDRDAYFDTTPHGFAVRQAYQAHIAALLELSGMAAGRAVLCAGDVIDFETELARSSLSRRALARDVGARFRPIDVDAADREGVAFSWSALFDAMGVARPARFSLAMPTFHAKAADMLLTASPAIWRAYLRYHVVDDAAQYLGGVFAHQHHRFHADALRGRSAQQARWKQVLGAIDEHVGEAMGELYVARSFSNDAKRQMLQLVEHLRGALAARLENLEWMSVETRRHALDKLAALNVKVAYPDRWRSWAGLATTPRSLYANVLAARAFNQRWRTSQIGTRTDRGRWPMPPQTVNAGYDPQRNDIVFPAAILAPPFFDPRADPALNYGGIGAVIAHEMIHGYDDQGSRFDAHGRFRDWWLPGDRERFDRLTARLANRFDHVETHDGRLDSQLTLGENIADFGGLAVAFDALEKALECGSDPMIDGYTQRQRFFLNWAVIWRQSLTSEEATLRLATDTHAPARIRANAAPSNLPAYAQAFGCAAHDPMQSAPEDRIPIW